MDFKSMNWKQLCDINPDSLSDDDYKEFSKAYSMAAEFIELAYDEDDL